MTSPCGKRAAKREGFDAHRQKLELSSKQRADDAVAAELLPPALGLAVVHDEIRIAQLPGGAEAQNAAAQAPIEDDRGIAQGTPGDRDRPAADRVVDDLVPDHDAQRVGLGFAAGGDRDHRRTRGEVTGLRDRRKEQIIDGGYAVLGRAARDDLAQIDRTAQEVGARPLLAP
jgi:hypothetical protein